jgi:hypothetical protein
MLQRVESCLSINLIYDKLTNCMELRPSSETNSCAVTQELYGTRRFITMAKKYLCWFLF